MLTLCDKLGPPVKPEKVEGPTTLMEFLVILLDSINMTVGISPAHKAEVSSRSLAKWCQWAYLPPKVDRLQLNSETPPPLATSHQGNTGRSTVVATLSPKLVGHKLNARVRMDTSPSHATVHGCIQHPRLWCLLARTLVQQQMDN